MKTIDAIRFILSDIDPQHIDANRDAFLKLVDLVAAYDSLTPDWSKAPSWAQWYAIDGDGDAFWYESEPFFKYPGTVWKSRNFAPYHPVIIPPGIDWRDCIWKRQVDE